MTQFQYEARECSLGYIYLALADRQIRFLPSPFQNEETGGKGCNGLLSPV
jgi:hypothetical protein